MADRGTGPLAAEMIYDAMLDDDVFASIPVALTAAVGARSATTFRRHPDDATQIMAHSGYFSAAHYAGKDLWAMCATPGGRQNRVLNLDDFVPEPHLARSSFFNDWIRGMGDDTFHCLGSSVMTSEGQPPVPDRRRRAAHHRNPLRPPPLASPPERP